MIVKTEDVQITHHGILIQIVFIMIDVAGAVDAPLDVIVITKGEAKKKEQLVNALNVERVQFVVNVAQISNGIGFGIAKDEN